MKEPSGILITRPYRQRGYPHSTRVNPESETDVNVTWMTNRHFGKSKMVIVDGAADHTKCYSRVEEVVTTLHSCTITRQDYTTSVRNSRQKDIQKQIVTMSAPEESAPAPAPAVEQPEQDAQVEQKDETEGEVKADEPKPVTRMLYSPE